MHTSMWELVKGSVLSSSPLEQAVLALLIVFSVISWAIILMKVKAIKRAGVNNADFLKTFENADNVNDIAVPNVEAPAPLNAIYKSGMAAADEAQALAQSHPDEYLDKLQQRMQHTAKGEYGTIRWGLGFLASVASASPFIGLFGTVWGIMATFQNLGDAKSASLAVVAPGIAAALIATAMGLAVAIPAVMAYNALLAKIDELQEGGDMFIERVTLLVRTEQAQAAAARPAPAAKAAPAPKAAPVAVAAGKGH
jgi:biopolymer transport protein TolQ